MNVKNTELKERVKALAKSKKITLKNIYEHLGITQVAFDKSFYSKNFPYSKKLKDIADFLGVTVQELTGTTYKEGDQVNIGNERSEIYNKSICKNNFFADEKTELQVLRAENEMFKKIIDRQDKEIEFLRSQLAAK